MESVEWGCWAGLAASRPGPEPQAATFLNQILPSKQASKQAGPGGGLAKHSGIFVSSWLSALLPPHPCHCMRGALGVGLQAGKQLPGSWPPSPPAISGKPKVWSQFLFPVTSPSSPLLPS